MATRALRLLRQPLYSSFCRSRLIPASPSTFLSSRVGSPSWVETQRETSHPLKAYSAASSSFRHFASSPGETSAVLEVSHPDEYKSLLNEAKGYHGVSHVRDYLHAIPANGLSLKLYDILHNVFAEDKKLAVVYFTAKWCGPCRHVSPVVNALSKEFGDVKFLKVDLDELELQKTIEMAGIAAVPTFQFHLEGKMVSGFSGADSKKLRDTIQELLEEAKA